MSETAHTTARQTRTVALLHADAPQLPFLAGALDSPFTAVTQEGWSAVLVAPGVDPVALAAAGDPGSVSVVLTSDGESRTLRVCPPVTALESHADWREQLADLAEATTLRWGPEERDETSAVPGAASVVDSPSAVESPAVVESIASLCDLDPAATARLENYARTPSSALLLESVLQLLGLPVVAAKIAEQQRELHEFEGVGEYEPRTTGLSLLDAASVEPSGNDVLARIQRAYVRRPALLLAVGGAEIALGAGLAGLASRGGRGAKLLGSASALMFSDAAVQTALWAAVRARKRR